MINNVNNLNSSNLILNDNLINIETKKNEIKDEKTYYKQKDNEQNDDEQTDDEEKDYEQREEKNYEQKNDEKKKYEQKDDEKKNYEQKDYEKTYWEILNKPKYVLCPMVDLSELPFRLLCRKYNCDLAFTPMINSKIFSECEKYRKNYLQTCTEDEPLIYQFCGNNSKIILKCINLINNKCIGIDLNFGCPQQIAKKGNYGAFLLNKHDEITSLVSDITNNTDKFISCKIRKIDNDYQKTLNLCYDLEQRNIKMITIHGRTKEEKGEKIKECDYDIIKLVKERLNIPIIANGSIEYFEDIKKCLDYTKADAVMCGEIVLENPHFFSNKNIDRIDIVNEYINLFLQYETNTKYLRGHLFKILYRYLQVHTDLRDQLNLCCTLSDYLKFQEILNEKKKEGTLKESSNTWYRRYRKTV